MPARPISIRRACAPIRRVFSDDRPLVAITHASRKGRTSACRQNRLSTIWMSAASIFLTSTNISDRLIIKSEEHTSELQSLMRISYAVFCLKKKTNTTYHQYKYKLRLNKLYTT